MVSSMPKKSSAKAGYTLIARVLSGIDHDRLADRLQQPFRRAGVKGRVIGAGAQIVLQRVFDLPPVFINARVKTEDAFVESHFSPQSTNCRPQQFDRSAHKRRSAKKIRAVRREQDMTVLF